MSFLIYQTQRYEFQELMLRSSSLVSTSQGGVPWITLAVCTVPALMRYDCMNICALYVCTYIHVHTHNKQNDYWSVDTTRAGTLYLQQQLVLSHLSRHPRSRKSDSWNGVSGHCLGSPVSGLSWRLAKRKVHTRAFSSDSGSGTLNSCIQSIYILHIFTYDRIFSDDDLFLWMHANKGSSMLTTLHFGPPWSGHQAAATIPLPECSWLAPWPPRYPVKTASWSSPSLRTKTRRALYWP